MLDGQSVVQEIRRSEAGKLIDTTTYLLGPRGVEYREVSVPDPGTGVDIKTIRWYIYDGLGSVLAEVDGDGVVTATNKLDVYGNVRATTGTSDSNHKFCGSLGHTTEPDTGGLIYMRARWYDPAIGRFISEDPAGDGVNWYSYCDGNPVNAVDLDGRAVTLVGVLTGVALGAGLNMAFQSLIYGSIDWSLVVLSGIAGGAGAAVAGAILGPIKTGLFSAVLGQSQLEIGRRALAWAAGGGTRMAVKGAGGAMLSQQDRALEGPLGRAMAAYAGNYIVLDIICNFLESGISGL